MSLINQVLNQLEQRGAHTSPEQTLVRAVPMQAKRRWEMPALLAAVVVATAVAVWQWPKAQAPKVEPVKASAMIAPVAVSSVPVIQPDEPLLPASKLSLVLSATPQLESPVERRQPKPAKPVPSRSPAVAKSPKPVPTPAKPTPTPAIQPVVNVQPPVELPLKQISHTQRADAEYRKAQVAQQQGHVAEALAGYDAVLKLNARHDAARLAQAALLIESKRGDDAERLLQEGLQLEPTQTEFSMVLARVQVERGKVEQALQTLQNNLPEADDKADYQAFYAALLQREGRHKEALNNYQIALKLVPNNGIWLMGYAISLQAVQRLEDAKAAYLQALATQTLSPELTAFVQQRLKGL